MSDTPFKIGDKVNFPDVVFKRNGISFRTLQGTIQAINGHRATIKRGKNVVVVPLIDVTRPEEMSAVGKYFTKGANE